MKSPGKPKALSLNCCGSYSLLVARGITCLTFQQGTRPSLKTLPAPTLNSGSTLLCAALSQLCRIEWIEGKRCKKCPENTQVSQSGWRISAATIWRSGHQLCKFAETYNNKKHNQRHVECGRRDLPISVWALGIALTANVYAASLML